MTGHPSMQNGQHNGLMNTIAVSVMTPFAGQPFSCTWNEKLIVHPGLGNSESGPITNTAIMPGMPGIGKTDPTSAGIVKQSVTTLPIDTKVVPSGTLLSISILPST